MRRLLICGVAAAALVATARAQAPLQITPPIARPPASIPGKPAKKPAPPKHTETKPVIAKSAVAKPVATKPTAPKPALKKSIEPKATKSAPPAPPPSAPSAFARETVPAAPFAPPEKLPAAPAQSQQAALQPQTL